MQSRWLRAALFHYGRWLGNGDRALREVKAALAATPHERVLDMGCGTGGFCRAVPGEYLGIDVDADYIDFARRRWASSRRRFEHTTLDALDTGPGFDKAMLIACLHHLSDAEVDATLAHLRGVVRRRLVVLDADPEDANWLQATLLALDRGHFIRPAAVQRALLERYFAVTCERRFPNTPRTLVHTLFVCEPRP
jgi:2-polyprenyl-3-methyl-5-hydroxy-6-metoxy-1,4-benzoquinol methylase